MRVENRDHRDTLLKGADGLPAHYPVPSEETDLQFFIQKNKNCNTVIYQLNRTADGFINQNKPLNVYWKEYEDDGHVSKMNFLQERLAYGYTHKVINNETVQISIVSYPSYKMYITKTDIGYKTMAKFKDNWVTLTNIYVFADELGAFPNVKYIELYGEDMEQGIPYFDKINISE